MENIEQILCMRKKDFETFTQEIQHVPENTRRKMQVITAHCERCGEEVYAANSLGLRQAICLHCA